MFLMRYRRPGRLGAFERKARTRPSAEGLLVGQTKRKASIIVEKKLKLQITGLNPLEYFFRCLLPKTKSFILLVFSIKEPTIRAGLEDISHSYVHFNRALRGMTVRLKTVQMHRPIGSENNSRYRSSKRQPIAYSCRAGFQKYRI